MVRQKLGMLKLRALRALYENTEDGKVYAWNRLVKLLVDHGISTVYARQLLWDFYLYGLLERLEHSLYKVNRARLKAYIEEYEAILVRLKARGGSGGGPGPSQELR